MSHQEQEQPGKENGSQFDELLCEGRLYNEPFTIRMRGSVKREEGVRERREIVKLRSVAQPRDYVFVEPYILLPDIRIGIDLYPTPSPTGAIGQVASTDWIGMKQERIGDGQAWYYHQDRTLILWELTVFSHYEQDRPLEPGGNLMNMWQGFERFLVEKFPQARRMATLGHDPDFETLPYQAFLRGLGYGKRSPETFSKAIKR
jgi:hypothetical protein